MDRPIVNATMQVRLCGHSSDWIFTQHQCEVCESLDTHDQPIEDQPLYDAILTKTTITASGQEEEATVEGVFCWDCLTSWFEL